MAEKVVECSKCKTGMVQQSDVAILTLFQREPSGRVSFCLTDDIPARVYVCPKCHYIELYYDSTARHTYSDHEGK